MKRTENFKIWKWLALVLFLLACGIFSPVSPAPTVVSESQFREELGTMIAYTAAAAQTQTATLQPPSTLTLTPSITPTVPTPTPTFFFSLFTSTPVVVIETSDPAFVAEEGGSVSIPGAGAASAPIPYSGRPWTCIGIGRSPSNGAAIQAGTSFIAHWTVVNTGTKTWTSTTVDFIYKSGYRHEGKIIQDISSAVSPGRSLTVKVLFTAPKSAGEYYAVWSLKVGSRTFCGVRFYFVVPE